MSIRRELAVALLLLLFAFLTVRAYAQEEGDNQSLADAVTSGTAHVGFRYRYENVDQDGFSDEANREEAR